MLMLMKRSLPVLLATLLLAGSALGQTPTKAEDVVVETDPKSGRFMDSL